MALAYQRRQLVAQRLAGPWGSAALGGQVVPVEFILTS